MKPGVIIPFGSSDEARTRARDYTVGWYRVNFPNVPVLVAVGRDDRPWSKGGVVDEAIRLWPVEMRPDVLVVADGDVLVPPSALLWSLAAVEAGAAWSQPHETVYRLSQRFTERVYTGEIRNLDVRGLPPRALERRPHRGPNGGGIVVCSIEAYYVSGGIDPRFVEWGGEDISWARALDTLAGPCRRHDSAPMWHLWHPRADRRVGNRASPENELLANRYLDASGDPAAMRALVDERVSA